MATVTAVLATTPQAGAQRYKWEGFADSGDVGTAVTMRQYRDRSVQVLGTFTGGLEITLEGSLDGGTTWAPLTDPQGNSIVITSAKIEAVTEMVDRVRPRATAGSGGADVDVWMFFGGDLT